MFSTLYSCVSTSVTSINFLVHTTLRTVSKTKEHLSVLGEFGTGKTWFALHYAWIALQEYKKAKEKGIERPRLPLVIPLRDYAKAVTVESLFSEFFFRKHEIPLPGYTAFEQLNRMGKLLLIFDGFDEMAARIDKQAMIDNFWQLARVIVPGAKAILTCRTEHFPEAKEGRAILNAELKASTANLTGESPQFEVLELEKFNDEQICQVLSFQTKSETINKIMSNQSLVDLARRPVMIDLIVEALPKIESKKHFDIARVYLYAIRRKMERDIKENRTFTSMIDKLYFLCELAWEMLTTDRLNGLNYREFPERIQHLFGEEVKEQKKLDHWQYDMTGQTILTRNADGDYSFAHRSFLEFFVAYKVSVEIGIISNDFIEPFWETPYKSIDFDNFTWSDYFQYIRDIKNQENKNNSTMLGYRPTSFDSEDINILKSHFGQISLSIAEKAVLQLIDQMIDKNEATIEKLLNVIKQTKEMTFEEAGYLGSNAATLLLKWNKDVLSEKDLSYSSIINTDFTEANLSNTNFSYANLSGCTFAHTFGSIFSLVFSPSDNLLALGDSTGSIRLFNVFNPQDYSVFKGHHGIIRSIYFSPDGEILASASEDGTAKLWNCKSGECLRTLKEHTKGVRAVAFSPDGKTLASASEDGKVKIWNCKSGECSRTLEEHTKGVRAVAFSPDGETLASASEDGKVKIWNCKSGECSQTLEHSKGVWDVLFDINNRVITSGAEGLIKIWDSVTGQCLSILKGHKGRIRSISIDISSSILASGSEDLSVRLWDINTGKCLDALKTHKNWIRTVAISPDGKILASGSEDRVIKIWNIVEKKDLDTLIGTVDFIKATSLSKDSKTIALRSQKNSIKLWKLGEKTSSKVLCGHNNFVRSLTFSCDDRKIISGSDDGEIKIWDVNSGREIKTLFGHVGWVNAVTSNTKNNLFVSGGEDKIIRIWDINSDKYIKELKGHRDGIRAVSFCFEGTKIASGSADRNVKIWDVESGRCLETLKGHQDWVISVAFSHCGCFLATGSSGKNIIIWDLKSSRQLLELKGHQDWVYSVVFSSNRNTLMSGSRDGTIKVWDLSSGECIKTIKTTTQDLSLLSAIFNQNGSVSVCGSEDGTISFWDIKEKEKKYSIHDGIYEGMNIFKTEGLTYSQINDLKNLGAINN